MMYIVATQIMQLFQLDKAGRFGARGFGMSSQKLGLTSNTGTPTTSARSRRAVARVVGLLVLVSMPHLGVCTQMYSSRLQLSKHLSRHQVVEHGKQHVAIATHSEKAPAMRMAPEEPVLLQVSENHEETQNRTAAQAAPWPWVQPGAVVKKTDAIATPTRARSDTVAATRATNGLDAQQVDHSEVTEATSGFEVQHVDHSEVSQGNDVAKVNAPAADPSVGAGFQIATLDNSQMTRDTDVTIGGSSESVVRGLTAIQEQLPSMMMNGRLVAMPAFIAVAVFVIVTLLWFWASMRWSKATGPRMHVEALKLSYGAQVENLLQAKDRYDSVLQTPLSQSNVVRIQGRVVPGPHGTLTSPLWQRESVMYSASVTQNTTGSPLTVHSRSVDFAIQLLDAPHIHLAVAGPDANLFDMKRGVLEKNLTLKDAGENWTDFVLNHAGAERTMDALQSEDLECQFREEALPLGAIVTCVGELRRDQCGVLGLWPWQKNGGYTKADKDSCDPFGSDLEKVLISDDASLFPKSSRNTIPWDCCAEDEDETEDEMN